MCSHSGTGWSFPHLYTLPSRPTYLIQHASRLRSVPDPWGLLPNRRAGAAAGAGAGDGAGDRGGCCCGYAAIADGVPLAGGLGSSGSVGHEYCRPIESGSLSLCSETSLAVKTAQVRSSGFAVVAKSESCAFVSAFRSFTFLNDFAANLNR